MFHIYSFCSSRALAG
uniref:Uncharacterized protein n=1 Tax=Anguilla anguilla TaxID=7936 RepID=A0A0E9QVT8_ANGAN